MPETVKHTYPLTHWIGDFVERTWPWFFLTCCAICVALWALGRYIDKRRAR